MEYPSKLIEDAVNQVSKLPGIGKKTALRLVLHLIKDKEESTLLLTDALKKLPPTFLQTIAKAVQENRFNTLSSAYFLMAYQAYSDAVPAEVAKQLATELDQVFETWFIPRFTAFD